MKVIEEVRVNPINSGCSGCDLFLNGTEFPCGIHSVAIDAKPGCFPMMTLKIPFKTLQYDGPQLEELQKENAQLKQMVEDLNRKIAILLDT